jgi:RNA-directed DNA polymerase
VERKPESKTVSLRTETAYKANGPGKVAQHTEARGSGPGVNAEVVQLQFVFLSGETSMPSTSETGSGTTGNLRVEDGGVSRGHSTALAKAGRPEPIGCDSTPEPRSPTETPHGRVEGPEDSAGKHGGAQADLLERILSRENMLRAWQRVKANRGAAGMDGMSTEAFPEFARHHWERIRSALEKGTYHPAAVLRVMIPKASGGERPLGIPTVLDRVIQQAIAQVIGPLFEPHFSTRSYGFRPGRSAGMALEEMVEAHREGLRFAVDCDLKRFFDTVHHGLLMNRLARRIADRRVLRLIGRYLRAGVILPDGRREPTPCGVPQGGPLSPLLANVMLDDLDKELERRGLRFARYADDFLIFVRSQRAAQRVLQSISQFIEGHLRLRINPAKTKAARLSACAFLGFELRRGKLHWTDAAVERFKARVREITKRSNGRNMKARIKALKRYVSGWLNYFGHSRSYAQVVELDQWLRRRVRLCYWKQWKRPRTRRRHLLALGIPRDQVKLATRSRKGYWRMAGNSIVQRALTKQWLWNQGVPDMRQQWIGLHYGASAS